MGLPFVPIFGLYGSDLLEMGPDYRILDNPYVEGQRVIVAPALRPDVTLIHAPRADVFGNVIVPGNAQVLTTAMASNRVIVTAEEVVEQRLTPADAAGDVFISGIYVTAVAHVPRGAHPAGVPGFYRADDAHIRTYLAAARAGDEAFAAYVQTYVHGVTDHEAYLRLVDAEAAAAERSNGATATKRRGDGERDAARGYTDEELMAVLMSRNVRDGETAAAGAKSPIPAAGLILAQETAAPHATVIVLGSKSYYPFRASSEFHYLAQRGGLDLFHISGLQVDAEGNFNLHQIGDDHDAPDLRNGGGFGTAMLYQMAKRVVLFRTEHTRRSLVQKVDFVTGSALQDEHIVRLGGPAHLITPMATLRWVPARPGWELASVHPGYTVAEVLANTGFDLPVAFDCQTTPAPTADELRMLRTVVREKLAETYADFARERILSA